MPGLPIVHDGAEMRGLAIAVNHQVPAEGFRAGSVFGTAGRVDHGLEAFPGCILPGR